MEQLLTFQKGLKLYCSGHQYKNSSYSYTITIIYSVQNKPQIKYTIQRTKKQIQKFHQSIQKIIFELDDPFDKKYINKEQVQQTTGMINNYLVHIKQRLDCLTSRYFVSFFQFDNKLLLNQTNQLLIKQYVQQLTQININNKQQEVVDFQWEQQFKIIFVISQCKKQTKIQNLFKLFISNDTGINGTLQLIHFNHQSNQWTQIHTQNIQAEPLKVTWNHKSSILVISTTIGIYVYMVGLGNNSTPDMNLIDFVQIPGISTVCCDSQLGQIYVLGNGINYQGKSKLYGYSIKNQSAIQIPSKLIKAKSMVFQKTNRRLYISEQQGIKIFRIQNDSHKIILQNFKRLHTLKHESQFEQLKLSSEQKPQYLFGYSRKGFITVFEIKPVDKQYLMNVLTNIQCPQNFISIDRIWLKKMFSVNYGNNIVFISMKNQPIYIKQSGIGVGRIRKIIFDQSNQRLLYSDSNNLKICQIKF